MTNPQSTDIDPFSAVVAFEPEPETTPPQLLTDRLVEWAAEVDHSMRAAVTALVQEDAVLARADVHALLLVDTGMRVYCEWTRFEDQYRKALVLDTSERAFLDFVVAIAFPRQVPLWPLEHLGERRLAVILRALASCGGSETIAVGVRT
ncbi:hypothetical protein [Streptomyces sp. NPDC005955]|uniref:hypothetical protein n=1 Tax=Streptomyces sp. NPDC005955 TaxID=3364738 RepID=UPI0036B527CB